MQHDNLTLLPIRWDAWTRIKGELLGLIGSDQTTRLLTEWLGIVREGGENPSIREILTLLMATPILNELPKAIAEAAPRLDSVSAVIVAEAVRDAKLKLDDLTAVEFMRLRSRAMAVNDFGELLALEKNWPMDVVDQMTTALTSNGPETPSLSDGGSPSSTPSSEPVGAGAT